MDAGRVVGQQMDIDKRILGFAGPASSMHYVVRMEEKLMPGERNVVPTVEPKVEPKISARPSALPPPASMLDEPRRNDRPYRSTNKRPLQSGRGYRR